VRKPGWTPQPGDLIKLNFDPQSGHEQSGWRPALVISESVYNARAGLVLVCPITNQVKHYPFEVPLPDGCAIQGVVLADQIKSIDFRARKARHIEAAPQGVLDAVRAYVALLIGCR
jgi:mRNA interferase MazF